MKLFDVRAPNLWGHFKDGILKTCEACGKKIGRRKGDTWWWNEEMKEVVSRKKRCTEGDVSE